jgi:hypothetical protein
MWLRTDEREDVLASLSLCVSCLDKTAQKPVFWKWAILAIHNALQGAMVCHLSGTAQLGALTSKSAKAWLDWHERDRRGEIERERVGSGKFGLPEFRIKNAKDKPPREKLAIPDVLFERLYDIDARIEFAGEIIAVTESERSSFRKLTDLRNGFAHFTPKGWAIELDGLPRIFLDILNVIVRIAEDPWAFRHMKNTQRDKLQTLLGEMRGVLENFEQKAND